MARETTGLETPETPSAAAEKTRVAPATSLPPLVGDDVLRLVWLADPQISPEGKRILAVKVWVDREEDEYRSALWLLDAEGGVPHALTFGTRDSQPRWSPDGRSILFVRATEPKKPGQLHLLPMDGGEPRIACRLEKGASEPVWSPDGKRIAFLSETNPAIDVPEKAKPKNEPARVVTRPVYRENDEGFIDFEHRPQVWVMEMDGGPPRQLTSGPFATSTPRWTPDGRWILFVSDRRPEPWFGHEESVLYAIDPNRRTVASDADLKVAVAPGGAIAAYAVDPAGRIALAASTHGPEYHTHEPFRLLVASGEWPISQIEEWNDGSDWEIAGDLASDQHPPRGGGATPLAFEPSGSLLVRVARHGASTLARVSGPGSEPKPLMPGEDLIAATASADGRRWAMTIGGFTRPGDLHVFDAGDGTLRKLWGPNDEFLGSRALADIEEMWFDARDGRKVQGWIVKPPGFDPGRRHPMVLEIHGGPHVAYGRGFFHEFQVLAGAGYVVLYTNPRGSTTSRTEFARLIQYNWPGDDADDLLSGVDALLARGYVDEKRMGITGGSGGGLLTNWVIAHTDRFAAALTQRCVSDWASMAYSSDFALFTPFWFRKPP